MAIVAGIDEAGLGPLLGPLVVTGVAFQVPDDRIDGCLWDALRSSCTSTLSRGDSRLTVGDSKRLYRPRSRGGDIGPLERAALVMLESHGGAPRTWRALLERIAPRAVGQLDDYPWYRDRDVPLPLSESAGDLPTRANALRRDFRANGVALRGVFCEPLPEGHFNQLVTRTKSKGGVSLTMFLRILSRILDDSPHEHVSIFADRLGGRTHYREVLSTAFPGHDMTVLEESKDRSAYRMTTPTRRCEVGFIVRGESAHFAVALASIYSKYVRELYMHVFNAYWSSQVAAVRPTAGYYSDARRWLREMRPELRRRRVDRETLVRLR